MQADRGITIQFEAQQLRIRCSSDLLIHELEQTYRHLLTDNTDAHFASIDILQTENGLTFTGPLSSYDLGPDIQDTQILMHLIKHEVLSVFVKATPGLLWLHAGAVAKNGRALLLPGSSGQGKSTLVTLLSGKGWLVLSDEAAPIDPGDFRVIPFPQQPVRRIHPGRIVAREEIGGLQREPVHLEPDAIATAPPKVELIVFPVFDGSAESGLTRLRPGDAALQILRQCMSFTSQKQVAVERVASLSKQVPVYNMRYVEPSAAADLLETIL